MWLSAAADSIPGDAQAADPVPQLAGWLRRSPCRPSTHALTGDGLLVADQRARRERAGAYIARLRDGRYASNTMARGAVAHFAHWMALCRLPVERLDESRVAQFLHEHLPHCGCPAPAMRHPREAHAALMPLLALLRQRGVISDLPSPTGPIADELSRHDAHMRDARGLSAVTRVNRLRIVQRLLLAKFAGRPLKF